MLLLDCKRVTSTTASTDWTPLPGQVHKENQTNAPMMWLEFVNQLTSKHKATFQHLTLTDKGPPIVQAIMSGNVIAVLSNGSFKEGQGTTAWMFYDQWDQKTSLGEGVITTPRARTMQGAPIKAN